LPEEAIKVDHWQPGDARKRTGEGGLASTPAANEHDSPTALQDVPSLFLSVASASNDLKAHSRRRDAKSTS
jgi:hypothetical protein